MKQKDMFWWTGWVITYPFRIIYLLGWCVLIAFFPTGWERFNSYFYKSE